ncbi:MAG: disulfide bond formation protein DsbA [Alphaproteobacteria bacterium]|nr:disulfide bond formation protein DsbA [Alphaproteobacteria bacterium]|tara:strand:+ start:18731 stop:19495 length:765 start_codon:yes stop_codon:yes gene_type:complete
MTSSDNNQKKSGIVLIILGAILVAGSLFVYMNNGDKQAVAQSTPAAPIADGAAVEQSKDAALEAALAPRTLGSDDAPVKIKEYASLSCGHCAHFHTEILPEFKKKFIDTNQVQLIFSEFPLNNSALEGAMIARCLPADQYIDFTGTLFENIEDWAYQADHTPGLKKIAKEFGMTDSSFDACLKQAPLREALVARMRAAAKQWQIGSTPSFLIANDTVITGAQNADAFAPAIEKALAGKTVEETTETQTTTEAAE